jgi:O-antigen/teichoic acid export membrane protein
MYIKELTTKARNFLQSTTLFVMASILIGSFFSYALQFVLSRVLSLDDYGTFNALLSVTYLVSVPAGVFGTSIIKVCADLLAKKRFDKITALFWKLNFYALVLGLTLFIIIYLFKNNIASYLNISDSYILIPFAVFLGLSYLNIIPPSYLQGLLRFRAFSFATVFTAFFRMLLPIVFIFLGFKVGGVFYGFILTFIFSFFVNYFLLKKSLGVFENIDINDSYKRILSFGSSVLFINFGLMTLNNLDMIIVKRYFEPDIAGYYAGTVTLGKIFLFGAGTVATVMFPQISNLYSQKSKLLYPRFKKFFSLQLLLTFLGLIFFFVFPKLLTTLFFGDRFDHSVQYLPLFSIFIALYILINFMVLFFMAIERTKVFVFLIPTIILQYTLFLFFNSNINVIIGINILVSFLLLTALSIYFLKLRKNFSF